jgi:hypothetical protein
MDLTFTSNYNKYLASPFDDILLKTRSLTEKYLIYSVEKLTTTDIDYFVEGLKTINHVFLFLLYYTKNVELSYINSEKAICYYLDFVEEKSNKSNEFQQLSHIDAVLFVYRKTIYLVNNIYRLTLNTSECEKRVYVRIKLFQSVYVMLCTHYFLHREFWVEKNNSIRKFIDCMKLFKSDDDLEVIKEKIRKLPLSICLQEFNQQLLF